MDGERRRFRGTFSRYGKKRGWGGGEDITVLLTDVTDVETGNQVTGHLWFNLTKGFQSIGLVSGDVVEFDARVTKYTKGYQGRRAERLGEAWSAVDYKLSRPTKVALVAPGEKRRRQHVHPAAATDEKKSAGSPPLRKTAPSCSKRATMETSPPARNGRAGSLSFPDTGRATAAQPATIIARSIVPPPRVPGIMWSRGPRAADSRLP